jgi:ribokinase
MIGVIADDPAGFFLQKDLERVNVNCYLKISKQNPSSSILIVVEEDGERSFIINGKCLDELTLDDVPLNKIQGGNFLYTSAYNIENPPINLTVKELLKKSKGKNPFEVMFNLAAYTTVEKFREKIQTEILPFTDILVGNKEEFETLLGLESNELDPSDMIRSLKTDFHKIKVVLLTDGKNGCNFLSDHDEGHIIADKIKVADSTGAGDGFTAGFIYGYVKGLSLRSAIETGIKLGTHICQGFGARYDPLNFVKSLEKK